MKPETKTLLLNADCETGCEFPTDTTTDWFQIIQKVKEVKKEIEVLTGKEFQLDESVQDASFFTDLFILKKEIRTNSGGFIHLFEIVIRFSNFGDLVTMWTSGDKLDAEKYSKEGIIEILHQHGYKYVDADELDEIYDGKNDLLRDGKTTWWIRYFDYL